MRHKPILFESIDNRNKRGGREVIGLLGTHRGCGVTHTGLMLAFYMGVERGRKTAFLECNRHQDMLRLRKAYEWEEESQYDFSFRQISCYSEVSPEKITGILNDNYECVIMDFGTDFSENQDEFLRCDKKLIIGGKAEWELPKLSSFYNAVKDIRGNEDWKYFIPRVGDKAIKRIRAETALQVWGIPVNDEPVVPSQSINRFFDRFL